MKKSILVCLVVWSLPVIGHSQTNSTQLPNGVVVHESVGVEGVVVKSENQVTTRSVDDWNLAECIDAMRFIDLKLAESDDTEKEKYRSAKLLLQKRIDFLTTTK